MSTRRGFVLGLVLVLMPIAFLMMVTLGTLSVNETRFLQMEKAQTQLFYVAEAGLQAAQYAFASSNYTLTTHNSDGTTISASNNLLPVSLPGHTRNTTTGWYEWKWNPGDAAADNYLDVDAPHWYRFKVFSPAVDRWDIVCEAGLGDSAHPSRTTIHEVVGAREGMFNYALFDDGDLSEFVRGMSQTITGKVHANGNLYFRPSAANLQIASAKVTAAGKMIRFQDAWGRPDAGGTVSISKTSDTGTMTVMNGKDQGASGQGKAYDSYNADWLDPTKGAMTRWGGVVVDQTLGAEHVAPPAVKTMAPGGFYDRNASLHIDSTTSTTWCTSVTFYNQAEKRNVTVKQIDVSKMPAPSNGLVYSSVPVRLVNAQELPCNMTVVGYSTLYTRGDFNMDYPTLTAYNAHTSKKKSVALMTLDRIYHLSQGFSDAASSGSAIPTATDSSRYSGDPSNVVEINAALVDGAPTVDEINYRKSWKGVTNSAYTGTDASGTATTGCWANSDDFLENLGSCTVKKRGSVVHLENAEMANFSNSNAAPGVSPWIMNTHYSPPTRDYAHDPLQLQYPPPFAPLVARRLLWSVR